MGEKTNENKITGTQKDYEGVLAFRAICVDLDGKPQNDTFGAVFYPNESYFVEGIL